MSANIGDKAAKSSDRPHDHDGALSKPVDLQTLLERIQAMLKLEFVIASNGSERTATPKLLLSADRLGPRHVEELARLGEIGFVTVSRPSSTSSRLPILAPVPSSWPHASASGPSISGATWRCSKKRPSAPMSDGDPRTVVLVVDDSPETLSMLTAALEQFGALVLVATDGARALTAVGADRARYRPAGRGHAANGRLRNLPPAEAAAGVGRCSNRYS